MHARIHEPDEGPSCLIITEIPNPKIHQLIVRCDYVGFRDPENTRILREIIIPYIVEGINRTRDFECVQVPDD
jgi:hypothetical protein